MSILFSGYAFLTFSLLFPSSIPSTYCFLIFKTCIALSMVGGGDTGKGETLHYYQFYTRCNWHIPSLSQNTLLYFWKKSFYTTSQNKVKMVILSSYSLASSLSLPPAWLNFQFLPLVYLYTPILLYIHRNFTFSAQYL